MQHNIFKRPLMPTIIIRLSKAGFNVNINFRFYKPKKGKFEAIY